MCKPCIAPGPGSSANARRLINQLRAVLLERGITIGQGRRRLEQRLAVALEGGEPLPLTPRTLTLIEDMRIEWRELDRRIRARDDEFADKAKTDPTARRLSSIPGIGPLNATALIAAIGDGQTFRRARDLAAWLGLVPRQATTGGKPRLLGISKRGNRYLRTLLVHAARAALQPLAASQTKVGEWLRGIIARAHKNVVVVALASKLARIAWAVLRSAGRFEARGNPAAA